MQVFEITRGAGVPSRGDEFRVEYNFSGSDGFPIPCEAFTNGEKCTSCVYQICANTTDEYGLDVYCPNVLNLNSTLDECTGTYTGAFEFRGWEDFLIDCDVNAGLDVCNEARELYEDNKVEYNTTCSSCEENAMVLPLSAAMNAGHVLSTPMSASTFASVSGFTANSMIPLEISPSLCLSTRLREATVFLAAALNSVLSTTTQEMMGCLILVKPLSMVKIVRAA